MNNSARSHRRVRFVTWFSIVTMMLSMFAGIPAMAEDVTPAIGSVSIACVVDGGDGVVATINVVNPTADGSTNVVVDLFANASPEPVRAGDDSYTASKRLAGESSVQLNLKLPPATADAADSVIARAYIEGDAAGPVSSNSLSIYASGGVTLCGTAPASQTDETATATATDTATATATDTATSTATATATVTQTATGTATATATATSTATATATTTPPTQYATVTGTSGASLRCRTAPVSGDTIAMLAPGSRVELRGAASDGWYPVKCAGRDGFASAQYLTPEGGSGTPPPSGEGGTATVRDTAGAGLRCRTAPVSGNVITVLADGTRVPLRGAVENGWAPVTCAGQAGWISTQYASIQSGGGSSTPTPTPSPTPGGGGTGKYGTVVNTGGMGLRCRTAPVSGAIIVVVPEGTKLETRGGASNGWYPVKCNNQDGYVSGDYFTTSDGGTTTPPPTSGGSGTAMVSGTGGGGLRCRTAPVDGDVITVMPEGTQVTTRGNIVNGWAPVKCAGQDGWASAAYLLFNGGVGSGELWMDVNLSTQYMRVYRGNTIIMQTYVSTGRPGFDTPTGTFYINRKLASQTMSGVLGGEYYYVPNVPWVMYFTNRGHAIHGAYWHNNFGHVMSHGCINLPVSTAEWLYSITPIGTRVRIHY